MELERWKWKGGAGRWKCVCVCVCVGGACITRRKNHVRVSRRAMTI